jgi:hypothetical protein
MFLIFAVALLMQDVNDLRKKVAGLLEGKDDKAE